MKPILIFITMLFFATSNQAQTNYYTATKTFYENGYTYQCDVSLSKRVTIYNKTNKWTYTYPKYKDTGKHFAMPDVGMDVIQYEDWTASKRVSIVNAAFSSAEKQQIKGHEFSIRMYIDSTTGRITEVEFSFVNFGPYATIPLSVFRKIETELIRDMKYTPTSEGTKLDYISYAWRQEPK